MTLILTELSEIGIVMAADSFISPIDPHTGRPKRGKRVEWPKILLVPSIKGAISYWGMIGAITNQQFDLWLRNKVINSDNYDSLETFAYHLANTLNQSLNNKPLKVNQNTGFHVAGYSTWADGIRRPTFFHVHNGHLAIEQIPELDDQNRLLRIRPIFKSDPIKLFEKHQDFPHLDKSLEENLDILHSVKPLTRNGDFFIYAVVSDFLQRAFAYVNLIPDFSLPNNPTNLGSRKDFLQMMMETMIRIYKSSSYKQSPIIGGRAVSLAIGPKGYIKPIADGIK